jgi:hypothetical protein
MVGVEAREKRIAKDWVPVRMFHHGKPRDEWKGRKKRGKIRKKERP